MIPYEHTQPGTVMRVGLGLGVLGVLASMVVDGRASGPGMVLALVLAALLWLHHALTVQVAADEVRVAFGPGLIRRSIPVGSIRGASIGRCAWYNGWGIRATAGGWLFRVSGMSTVDLTLSGGAFRIGTDDPEGLLAAIEQAMAAHKGAEDPWVAR